MALTIGGKDFERPGATGMMKGSGIFMHDSAADRPAPEFAGVNTIAHRRRAGKLPATAADSGEPVRMSSPRSGLSSPQTRSISP